ncbi:DUF1775 domain-containing protein [Micromonospora terminaliae]|uniref:DUF1775 domain-containing protein n=1 Tax=Micromonospora terminaliae TaxID=1914461 RepID=A0AAJ3DKZ9_9ACTN|nr:DUF1775 domain-containing protein [Micromonospora terminaliae]NES30364.1 DUF1775 domain-containing protein [Micromonospora terminaliae]QGL46412.1 DUF1775 domain-containing protein [Micromonospora terminaliae]
MTMTRRGRWWAIALLAAVAGGTLGWPGAASAAEVTVTTSPAQVHQGDAIELAVVLPEERAGSRTSRIELRMPTDAPIGEVYPLSVPDWAPSITTRTLDQPVAGIHSSELNQVTDAVTWIRMPGGSTGPARLSLGMGPMPATDKLTFTVIQTYADGTVVRWADPPGGAHPAPTVALLPPPPGAAAHGGPAAEAPGHAGHGDPAAEAPAAAAPPRPADDGPSADLLLGGGLLAGLAGGAALGWLLSRRRRDTLTFPPDTPVAPDDDEDPPGEPRPAAVETAPLSSVASR